MMNKNKILVTTLSLIYFCLSALVNSVCASSGRVEMLINNAKMHSNNGNYSSSLIYYNQAIILRPFDYELIYQRAFVMGKTGNYFGAIKDFSHIITNNKNKYPHATRSRADCYMAIRDYKRAIYDYNDFLRNNPQDGKVWSYLAEAYALGNRRELALNAIKKGLATKSHWSDRLNQLQVQIMSGQSITVHKPLSN